MDLSRIFFWKMMRGIEFFVSLYIFFLLGAGLPIPCPMGKLRMTVKSTTTPQPTVMPMNLGSNLANRKLPLQTIINNNLWQSRAIKEGKMSVIKTPQGMFIVCPKGGHNVVRRVTPPPVTTVHMQVREHSNYMDEKATWTRVGRYFYSTSQFF